MIVLSIALLFICDSLSLRCAAPINLSWPTEICIGRVADVFRSAAPDAGSTGVPAMLHTRTIWKGTEAESSALLEVLTRNCTCTYATSGALVRACSPHAAFVSSQRFVDGLLYGRRIADRLISEEWRLACR
jgi:hypothetical protein